MKSRQAWLFDLDGTLADTAPDLIYAINTMRTKRGLPTLPVDALRHEASNGARGLLRHGLELPDSDPSFASARDEFLKIYADNLCVQTRLFPGISELLQALDEAGIDWGIVTNKPIALAGPLVASLSLRPCTLLGGDSGLRAKPAPDLLWLAAAHLGMPTHRCRYLGDAPRDIEAGRAAGMQTIACGWGYLSAEEDGSTWGADLYAGTVADLRRLIPSP